MTKLGLLKRRFMNGKKILKTLVNNLGFKILAVVLAFILWLVVYNIDDPKNQKHLQQM